MIDWIKKMCYGVFNPNNVRDRAGCIIPDRASKKHSAGLEAKINNGDIVLPTVKEGETRCYKVLTKSTVVLKKSEPQ